MDFRILGQTEVLDGERRLELPGGRGRALLGLLILHAGEPVAADRIVDELWGEDHPRTATTVVQGLVSRLRRTLEPGRAAERSWSLLVTSANGYRLAIEPECIDANRFKLLLDEARRATPRERQATLSGALSLWRGPALADFVYEPFAQRAITALEELRIEAIEDRVDADLALGRAGELVAELEELIAGHPFRERLRGLLMLALYRSGRQAEALEAYRMTRLLLVEELGIEPGTALRDLEAAILRQDPSLARPVGTQAPEQAREASSSWLPRERRTVTVLALDVATAAEPGVDPEAVARLETESVRVAVEVLERYGARVEHLLGGAVMAFFGFPLAHEDDPLRAVRAALEVRTAVRSSLRAGIETGEIVVRGPGAGVHDAVAGAVVTGASRLQQAAADGDVIVGPAAARVLRGAVILKPPGDLIVGGTQVAGWRVLELVPGSSAVQRAFDAPMFGREAELTRLRSAFRRAVRSGVVEAVTVLGEAGIGKSRLAREVAASLGGDADVITLRCPAEGERPFPPVREAIVEAAGLRGWRALHHLLASGGHLDEIAAAIELRPEPATAADLFSALRRLFEVLASQKPLLTVIDDLHWADPTLLDLVDRLSRETAGQILLLCLARPDVRERRPEFGGPDVLRLGPLSSSDVESLVVERAVTIDAQSLGRIVELSQGNALFAEQLLAAVEDDADAVPLSLRGLLTMRLDRLGPGERDVLRCASVAGMEVSQDAVEALLPERARPFVQRHLEVLERKRLVERVDTTRLRFPHALIRLSAYQSMTRDDRAHLHERLAMWLECASPDQPSELDQLIRYHIEQAQMHREAAGARDVLS
jgi:DNA-binding SARP family transcriptional activator